MNSFFSKLSIWASSGSNQIALGTLFATVGEELQGKVSWQTAAPILLGGLGVLLKQDNSAKTLEQSQLNGLAAGAPLASNPVSGQVSAAAASPPVTK